MSVGSAIMMKVLCLSGSNTFAQNILEGITEVSVGNYLVKFYIRLTLLFNRLVLSLELFREMYGIQGFVFLFYQSLSCSSKKNSGSQKSQGLSNSFVISHEG